MKNKQLTTEQKLNEFIGKALQSYFSRRGSKILSKIIKSDPSIKKSWEDFYKAGDEFKEMMAMKYGKNSADFKALYPDG